MASVGGCVVAPHERRCHGYREAMLTTSRGWRGIIVVAVVAAVAAVTIMAVAITGTRTARSSCSTLHPLRAVATGAIVTPLSPRALPPSHDNDAGHARIPDTTPDADGDATASPITCVTR